MKALSIKQPWLYCITDLDKRVENRTWFLPKKIIGQRIYLHASKTKDTKEAIAVASHLARIDLSAADMPLGALVATAVISGIVTESDDKWFVGPYGWILEDVQKLTKPIPMRGALGFWDVQIKE